MDPTSGMLTQILNIFSGAMAGGSANITGMISSVLGLLITIEIIIFAILASAFKADIADLVMLAIRFGIIIWITFGFSDLVNTLVASFVEVGLAASNSGGYPVSMRDPSAIIDIGFLVTAPIAEYLANISLWNSLTNLQDTIMMGFAMIGIMLAFTCIAWQIFIVYIEFAMISTIGVLFIPFGASKATAFLTERIFYTMIAFGVRFAVLSAIISISTGVIQGFALDEDPTWKEAFSMLTACGALALLAWQAPNTAAGMLAGAPNLSASTATGFALGGGAAAKTILEQSQNTAATARNLSNIAAATSVAGVNRIRSSFRKD